MQIKQYEKASCKLFRQPPIDFSQLERDIQERILKGWEQGRSVDGVINTLLKDSNVIDNLASQISESLDFQRDIQLKNTTEEKETYLQKQLKEKREREKQLKAQYDPALSQYEIAISETKRLTEEKKVAYSASQKRLEEMRKRVKERLERVGGTQGLEHLLKVQEGLDAPKIDKPEEHKSSYTSQTTTPYKPQEVSSASGNEVLQKQEIKIEEKSTQTVIEASYKSESFFKRAGSTIWRILNYKIW